MKKDITLYYNAVCKEHSYDNGFCTKCGGYQPADYNESTGSYEIGNGGQMFWFSALVNGDGEHTQIQEAKPDAHGALVSDISLKNPADETMNGNQSENSKEFSTDRIIRFLISV